MSDELKALQDQVAALETSINDLVQKLPATNGGDVQVVKDEADQPFKSAGEYFQAVKNAAQYNQHDPRLMPLKASGMSEGVPADGGYLLQPQIAAGIVEKMYKTGQVLSLLSAVDDIGPNSNSMTYNIVDESNRADGSRFGGVQGYWVAEGAAITASKPKFRQLELKLKKVAALCYATDELLADTTALQSWLTRSVPEELRFKVEDSFFNGNNIGKPLGILQGPALLEATRVDANKIQFADISGMWARRWAGVNDYVWFINQDVTPQLDALILSGTSNQPTRFMDYGPDGILRIKGRPVYETEYNPTLGSVGDILLASMSQYQAIRKGGLEVASSIHVAFVTAEQAFRFMYRIDAAPLWNSVLTPKNGTSNTQSPFVALAATT